jgi:hypothetical protein
MPPPSDEQTVGAESQGTDLGKISLPFQHKYHLSLQGKTSVFALIFTLFTHVFYWLHFQPMAAGGFGGYAGADNMEARWGERGDHYGKWFRVPVHNVVREILSIGERVFFIIIAVCNTILTQALEWTFTFGPGHKVPQTIGFPGVEPAHPNFGRGDHRLARLNTWTAAGSAFGVPAPVVPAHYQHKKAVEVLDLTVKGPNNCQMGPDNHVWKTGTVVQVDNGQVA